MASVFPNKCLRHSIAMPEHARERTPPLLTVGAGADREGAGCAALLGRSADELLVDRSLNRAFASSSEPIVSPRKAALSFAWLRK
jgi:hypothetical protein